jgi:YD repeat-containing protein
VRRDGRNTPSSRAPTRDWRGRITEVFNNNTAQNVLRYTYDPSGDLTAVPRLVDAAENTWATTTYEYEHLDSKTTHGFEKLISLSGKQPVIYHYDEAGRLTSVEDAFGNVIDIDPNVAGQTQTVEDRLGGSARGDTGDVRRPDFP